MTEQELETLAYDMMAEFRKSVQNEHLHPWVAYRNGVKAGYKAAMKENEKLNEQVKLLERAVEFYDGNYWVGHADDWSDDISKILKDNGEISREALQKLKEMRGEK